MPQPQVCCNLCQADPECIAATHVPGSCWIKFSTFDPIQLEPARQAVACVTHKPPPPPPPGTVACTVSNDGAVAWSGEIAVSLDTLRKQARAATTGNSVDSMWSRTYAVGPVAPGSAVRFLAANVSSPCNWSATLQPGSNDASGPTDTADTGLCWVYGHIVNAASTRRAEFALPLTPLKDLVASAGLPMATVTALIAPTANGSPQISLTASGAATLYVMVTTASLGQFADNGFHLLEGETKTLGFEAWLEEGPFNETEFASTLHVHWLNKLY